MKKFIFCVVTGYFLVFTLFIGLPQMMGGRGGIATPKGGEEAPAAVSEKVSASSLSTVGITQQRAAVAREQPLPPQPLLDPKPFKRFETGPVETFYRNGTLSSEWVLDSEGGGVFKTYTPEGRPWMTLPFIKQVLDGEIKVFYPEGSVFSLESYLSGKRTKSFWQYNNGNPWLEMIWSPEGEGLLSALYSEDGKRVDLPGMKAEQSTGYFKAFDQYGNEVINLQQAGGEQNLILKSYYQSGVLSAEIGLRGQNLHGRMARYYPDGTLWMEAEFQETRLSHREEFYPGAKVLSSAERSLPEAQDSLEWKTHYADGKIFWQLTKLKSQDQTPVFQLTSHWQDETSVDDQKEKELL